MPLPCAEMAACQLSGTFRKIMLARHFPGFFIGRCLLYRKSGGILARPLNFYVMKIKYVIRLFFIFGLMVFIFGGPVFADRIITITETSPDGTKVIKYVNSKALELDRRTVRKTNKENNGVYLFYRTGPAVGANFIPAELSYDNRVFENLTPVYVTYNMKGYTSRGGTSNSRTIDISKVIEDEARINNVDPYIIYLIVKYESNFNNYAVSGSGAMGLMQLMPGTASGLGVRDAYDPYQNIAGGTSYFCTQLSRFGNLRHALAAYNAGPGKVAEYGGVPPFAETCSYVENIFNDYYLYRSKK